MQLLENFLLHFKQWLNMDLLNSPFKDLFNAHLEMLRTSINTDEINLIVNIGDIVKTEKQKPQQDESKKELKPLTPTKEEDIEAVKKIIEPLKGKWNRKPILNETDFNRLTEYTILIIKTNKLPTNTKQFPNTGASIEFIRKTFHLAYLELSKTNRNEWLDLVHLFKQLVNTNPSTTSSKFSAYNGDYKKDKENLITY